MIDRLKQIKKTVVFLGHISAKGVPSFHATGFLVEVENIYHLLTAKHVVVDTDTCKKEADELLVFFNSKDGKIVHRSIESIKRTLKVDWIFHDDDEVDIAIIPFGLDPQDDVKVVPEDLFLSSDRIFELYDIFFLSYQPGVEPKKEVLPVIRGGIVSMINDDKSFYVDASAFPGNSGSPVFLKPSLIRYGEKGITLGTDPLGFKLVGLIGEYIPYREMAISVQTRRPRVIFEENTGLSRVWSVECIQDIQNSDKFKKQIERIRSPNKP